MDEEKRERLIDLTRRTFLLNSWLEHIQKEAERKLKALREEAYKLYEELDNESNRKE